MNNTRKIVGSAVIHSNQIDAGKLVCDKLLDGPTHLTAGCQSGKTGVVIYAVNQFLNGFDIDSKQLLRYREKDEDFNVKMSKTQVIWINARSDNYLRDQTEKRLTEAFGVNKVLTRDSISKKRSLGYDDDDENKGKLIGQVYIGHLCDLQIDNNDNLVQLKKVINFNEPILLILDESHVGQDKFDRKAKVGKDGKITEYNIGVLDNFCKNLGIYLAQPKDKWDARRYLLSMSATRPSWSVYIKDFRENFGNNYTPNIVHLHPGENYCGIAKDYDNVSDTRFVQAESFYDKKMKRVSNQIIDEVATLPKGKCIIIRCKLMESDDMKDSLERLGFNDGKKHGDYAYVKCGIHYKTADALNDYLTKCNSMKEYKTIFFIENFLGAGATFPNVRIHAQFERHNKSNPTAHIQSVGRSFGYSDDYTDENGDVKIFNKKDAKYKIYCDLDMMKLYKDGFNTDVAVYNDSAMNKKSRKTNGIDEWMCDIIAINGSESIHTTLQKYYFEKVKKDNDLEKLIRTKQNNVRISYTKSTEYLDLVELINKQIINDKEGLSIVGRIICINGSNNKHDKEIGGEFFEYPSFNSYKELMENIKSKNSWLCKFGVTESTFKDNYVCVYIRKKENVNKINYKIKKDSILSIS